MFEFAWPWIFLLAPLPWVLRRLLPPADSGESALRVSFLGELEGLAGRRAKARLPARLWINSVNSPCLFPGFIIRLRLVTSN